MASTKAPSRIKVWLGVALAVTLALGVANMRTGNDESDRKAVFEADLTPDKRNGATWMIEWGVRGRTTREQEPDTPFTRTLKEVNPGDRLWIHVLRTHKKDPRMRCSITVDGKEIPGRLYEGGSVCEALATVPA